ncbi:MAG: winged helix-turn-helix transcriptional regulator [Planctomycetes bacterium]|nr:winged helix-turn-helix transcriptional regulator [Planctomycetota bacterium]
MKAARTSPSRKLLSPQAIALVAQRFKALGEPARLRLINTLMQGELSVNDLVERTGLTQANVSKHLAQLVQIGFLSRRKEGAYTFYAIADESLYALCDLMCSSVSRKLKQDLDFVG